MASLKRQKHALTSTGPRGQSQYHRRNRKASLIAKPTLIPGQNDRAAFDVKNSARCEQRKAVVRPCDPR